MEFKGTKGKWYLQEYTDAYTNIIRSDNGKGFNSLFIAYTPQYPSKEVRYNAKLISKAPEMLEMLVKMINEFDAEHATHYGFELCYEAKQLIKEATEI
jgi:hypothetical protein